MTHSNRHFKTLLRMALMTSYLSIPMGIAAQSLFGDSVKMALYAEEIYEGYLTQIRTNRSNALSIWNDSIKALEESGADSAAIATVKQERDKADEIVTKKNYPLYLLAYAPWRYTIDGIPNKRLKHYTDGITIIHELVKDTTMTDAMRQTYNDELLALYDDWIAYADTLNRYVDNPFSKTYIRVQKIKEYLKIYGDSAHQPYWRKTYAMIQEVLNDSTDQISNYDNSLYYRYDIYSDRLYRENRAEHAEQYQKDYEIAIAGIEDAMVIMRDEGINTTTPESYITAIQDVFTANFRGTGNCEQDEETFRAQMEENFMDEKFLDKVIVTMQYCDSSEVFVEALENHLMYVRPKDEKQKAKRIKYAKLLANIYYKQERFDECLTYYEMVEKAEEDPLEKANIEYNMSVIYKRNNNLPLACRYVKFAIKNNPDYGDAYVQLAQIYADKSINWSTKVGINRLKFLLCVDKCEKALQCVRKSQSDAALRKYNRTSESDINGLISSYKSNVPEQTEVFFEGGKTSGTLVFDRGLMKGETTTIRFYN